MVDKNEKNKIKVPGSPVLARLLRAAHSRARSHCCSTRVLLAAGFPPWPGSHLLRQPGRPRLPRGGHIDAELSADAHSTWGVPQQPPSPQAVHWAKPPRRRITGPRHQPRLEATFQEYIFNLLYSMYQGVFCLANNERRLLMMHVLYIGCTFLRNPFIIIGFLSRMSMVA